MSIIVYFDRLLIGWPIAYVITDTRIFRATSMYRAVINWVLLESVEVFPGRALAVTRDRILSGNYCDGFFAAVKTIVDVVSRGFAVTFTWLLGLRWGLCRMWVIIGFSLFLRPCLAICCLDLTHTLNWPDNFLSVDHIVVIYATLVPRNDPSIFLIKWVTQMLLLLVLVSLIKFLESVDLRFQVFLVNRQWRNYLFEPFLLQDDRLPWQIIACKKFFEVFWLFQLRWLLRYNSASRWVVHRVNWVLLNADVIEQGSAWFQVLHIRQGPDSRTRLELWSLIPSTTLG